MEDGLNMPHIFRSLRNALRTRYASRATCGCAPCTYKTMMERGIKARVYPATIDGTWGIMAVGRLSITWATPRAQIPQ